MTNSCVYLIDSNVILDILSSHETALTQWSTKTLYDCANKGELAINQIIYAEVAINFADLLNLETALSEYHKLSLPWEAGFIASKAFAAYKRNGGKRHTLMPDFYIGAHALYSKLTLVTRDKGYRNYFPKIQLIAPANQS